MLKDAGRLDARIAGERITDQPDHARGALGVGRREIALEDAAGGAEAADAPVDAMGLVQVHRAGIQVVEEGTEVASLERAGTGEEHVVAEQVAQQDGEALGPAVAGCHRDPAGGEIDGEPAAIRRSIHGGGDAVLVLHPRPSPGEFRRRRGERLGAGP